METTTMTRQYIIARNTSGEPYRCQRCYYGERLPDHIVQWQVIHGGRLQIRVICNYCKKYIAFAQKNERNVRLADAARTFKG